MAGIRIKDFAAKLNPQSYKALESSVNFAKLRGNPRVELLHWILQTLNEGETDIQAIVRFFGLDISRLSTQLTQSLSNLPQGAGGVSGFSEVLQKALKEAWLYASLTFGLGKVRTGHVLLGITQDTDLRVHLIGLAEEWKKVSPEAMLDRFQEVVNGSGEEDVAATSASSGGGVAQVDGAPVLTGKEEALAKYSVDLTEKAEKGEIDPIFGRDDEIRQIIDILLRRRQNNPILTGEAGVGKTAVVEGLAVRLAKGDVPPALKGVRLRSLDLGLLQAGASMKGEFEKRLQSVIEEVQASTTPIMLFIDEAHQLIGAGGAAGQNDAANLLKPALARGTLRTVAATTWSEYKKYFEKDPALTRRFQVVQVHEPDEEKAVTMIRGLSEVLNKHHRVTILDEAVRAAVRFSQRYIPARQLPDKAVSLLDTACARVALTQSAIPARLEDLKRSVETSEIHRDILLRELEEGEDHEESLQQLNQQIESWKAEATELETRWAEESAKVKQILALREELRDLKNKKPDADASAEEADVPERIREVIADELKTCEKELAVIQGEQPLVLPEVDQQAVAVVVSDWTGVPLGRMVKDEIQTVLQLADRLEQRVVGQRHALDMIAERIQTARAGLVDPRKPIGVFMLAGTSGVGKTETALALAESLYGGEQNLITINMSEFQEAHTVSTLKGAPPGYVGYGEGGKLTEAVRRRPYSVVLLDEVEKAHPDVHEIFFQVFDKGVMEDGEGRAIDFKNTIIILTTNAGTDLLMSLCSDPDLMPDPEALVTALRDPLLKVFPPALLGRLQVIPYYPLSDEVLRLVIRLQLGLVGKRLRQNREIDFDYGKDVEDLIASRCKEVESGGRIVQSILNQTLLPEVSRRLLDAMVEEKEVKRVKVKVENDAFQYELE